MRELRQGIRERNVMFAEAMLLSTCSAGFFSGRIFLCHTEHFRLPQCNIKGLEHFQPETSS
jgi:hypothetical protein